jgi:hypothetical protein
MDLIETSSQVSGPLVHLTLFKIIQNIYIYTQEERLDTSKKKKRGLEYVIGILICV